ncbi:MerR family transcriptional regulator [Solihabitans fulvus]|uniref:MerR family transcriptional regulator n=1 Tax=Solihabitans fulvus TaxID=1892852 RepID=A0A5B2XNE6_9PSEU|nr:MerR family transcriptional regulator [Solihabitans fulvus]KAA2264675.1 MerR family transcriptional regulator [Solihabitans fulvus]
MRIGELADLAGTTTRALRYYEQQGLLMAKRAANGHREYDEGDLRLIQEIRSLQGIGFALEETRPFVDCLRAGNEAGDVCPASVAVYQRKLAELDACIDRLQDVRGRLRDQLSQVAGPAALVALEATQPVCETTAHLAHQETPCARLSSQAPPSR